MFILWCKKYTSQTVRREKTFPFGSGSARDWLGSDRARLSSPRLVMARARLGSARLGLAPPGLAWPGLALFGLARLGLARFRPGEAEGGPGRPGEAGGGRNVYFMW